MTKGDGVHRATHPSAPHDARPCVSVLVTTHLRAQRLRGCLYSLARQTLPPEEFEIVVVYNGPLYETPSVVESFRADHPDHRTRLIELRQPGASHARNVSLSSVRGEYVTFVDDDYRVSEPFLEALLRAAEPRVVAVAMIGDVLVDDAPRAEPDTDTYVGRGLIPRAGQVLEAAELVTAFSYNAAKLVWSTAARRCATTRPCAAARTTSYWLRALRHPSLQLPRGPAPMPMRLPAHAAP